MKHQRKLALLALGTILFLGVFWLLAPVTYYIDVNNICDWKTGTTTEVVQRFEEYHMKRYQGFLFFQNARRNNKCISKTLPKWYQR